MCLSVGDAFHREKEQHDIVISAAWWRMQLCERHVFWLFEPIASESAICQMVPLRLHCQQGLQQRCFDTEHLTLTPHFFLAVTSGYYFRLSLKYSVLSSVFDGLYWITAKRLLVWSRPGAFLCEVCMLSLCLCWFSFLCTPAFSHWSKTFKWGDGELRFVWRSLSISMWPWMGHLCIVSPCFCPMTAEMGSSRPAVTLSADVSWYRGWMDVSLFRLPGQ